MRHGSVTSVINSRAVRRVIVCTGVGAPCAPRRDPCRVQGWAQVFLMRSRATGVEVVAKRIDKKKSW